MTAAELKARGDTFLADERADEIQKFLENEASTRTGSRSRTRRRSIRKAST
jgi:hypothetical protein